LSSTLHGPRFDAAVQRVNAKSPRLGKQADLTVQCRLGRPHG
jgi:hypothetical protein